MYDVSYVRQTDSAGQIVKNPSGLMNALTPWENEPCMKIRQITANRLDSDKFQASGV